MAGNKIFKSDFCNTQIHIKPGKVVFVPNSNFKNCTFVISDSSIDDMCSFTIDFNKVWNSSIKIPEGGVCYPNNTTIENCTFKAEIESSNENDILTIGSLPGEGAQGEDGGAC